MDKLIVVGNNTLEGEVIIDGAKNSMVGIVPAALLVNGKIKITNVPDILDLNSICGVLSKLNIDYSFSNYELTILSKEVDPNVNNEYMGKYRGSYYFMGAFISRYKKCFIKYPGGCDIGKRPIDIHIMGFEKLGCEFEFREEGIFVKAEKLIGSEIHLPKKSVGATINIMLASCYAKGVSKIFNASIEPEVDDVINFLCKLGFTVLREEDTITILGKENILSADVKHQLIPDRIETMTYIVLGLLLGEISVKNVCYKHLMLPLKELIKAGALLEIKDDEIIAKKSIIDYMEIESKEYPFFPTDMIQLFSVLLMSNSGGLLTENVFEKRFNSLYELMKMNAFIEIYKNKARINVSSLKGSFVKGTDLRGCASLVIAGLCAKGETVIDNMFYMERGYSNFINKLKQIKAQVYPV